MQMEGTKRTVSYARDLSRSNISESSRPPDVESDDSHHRILRSNSYDDSKRIRDWAPRLDNPAFQDKMKVWIKDALPYVFFLILVLVVLWDMKSIKEMSRVIHNDHRNIWEPLNNSFLGKWFTRLDLCMLKVDNPHTDLKEHRAKNCSRFSGGKGVSSDRLFCGLGSSLGRPCTTPLSTKSYFKAGLIDGDLINPMNGYLKRSLRRIAKAKKAVVFLGDVMSKQNNDAMICEILRTDRVLIEGNQYYADQSSNDSTSNYTIHWRDAPLALPVHYIHVAHVRRTGTSRASVHDPAYAADPQYHKENSDSVDSKTAMYMNDRYNRFGNATMSYGRLSYSVPMTEVRRQLDDLLLHHGGFILIANIGVWYNTRERFRLELPEFMRLLDEAGKHSVVFFRETAAQHWNHTINGYFENGASLDGTCTPIKDSSPDFDWRNREVQNVIRNEHLGDIDVIPFHDLTAPLYQMHPDGDESRDCTRFCYFPQMWQTVWRAMDRGTHNNSKLLHKPIKLDGTGATELRISNTEYFSPRIHKKFTTINAIKMNATRHAAQLAYMKKFKKGPSAESVGLQQKVLKEGNTT